MIWRPCICNRYEAQRPVDFTPGTDVNDALDRAIQSASEEVEGGLGRVFYPSDDTRYLDWPNQGGTGGGQYADPWRLWLDENDLAQLNMLVSGGVTLTLDQVFQLPYDNPRKGDPYYTYIELDRAFNVQFGNNAQTPQLAIGVTGTWGYGAHADPAGQLAADAGEADTSITVTNGALAGPGDVVILGYGRGTAPYPSSAPHAGALGAFQGERMLVTDAAPVATGLTQSGAGVTSAQSDDQSLEWTGTGSLNAGEVITLDSEDMFVEKITGSVATVRRAFNGTTLASHGGAVIWAMRQWQVDRGVLGTASQQAGWEAAAAVVRHRVPQLVRDLGIGEASVQLMQEGSGYARQVSDGEAAAPAPGQALGSKWMSARRRHGRAGKGSRQRAV